MAPVGHVWPQRVQSYSQRPMRGTTRGVQSPSRPASPSAGCRQPVGQILMHRPQAVQRLRNSRSASEPGGRTRFSLPAEPRDCGVAREQNHAGQAARSRPRQPAQTAQEPPP